MQTQNLLLLTYLNIVFDNTNDGLALIDVENDAYRLLMTNSRLFEMTNGAYGSKDEGKLIKDMVPIATFKVLLKRYKSVIDSKQTVECTVKDVVDGKEKLYQIKFIPMLNAFDECTHIVTIVNDITATEALRKLLKDMELSR